MRGSWLSLNGEWDYAITGREEKAFPEAQGKILVPFAIESALSGVEKGITASDRLWYKKTFEIPESFEGKSILLHFDAVDWQCKVYINGKAAGSHTGGYCAFTLDITDALKKGENELTVCVYDPTDEGWQQRGKQTQKSHGFWYTATSGIWQTVWLEAVSESRIESIRLLPDIDAGTIKITSSLLNADGCVLKACVYDGETQIACEQIGESAEVALKDFRLWSPEEPNLYDLKLELSRDDEVIDSVKSYFGMRKFSIEKTSDGYPRLFLNNKVYFQNGLLDQGYWCDGVLTPPTDEAMIYDIQKMKELGFNMLRKHIKVEPARWYYHCDRLGMLVWQDMVSGGQYIGTVLAGVLPNLRINIKDDKYDAFKRGNPKWREDFRRELFEILNQLYNSVSICCWVPFNEGWGQFDAKQIGDEVKAFDPSRYVDHASGWYDQKGGDFKSIHRYIVPVTRPRPESRPFVLSEYGGYSRVIDSHVWNKAKSFGYKMYSSQESLTKAYKALFEKQIFPLIPKGLCALVYTQVSDVEFEVNGLLTYDRELVKLEESTVKELNAEAMRLGCRE
ncbi:MAG: glycoside hydrolase family 2 [Clostridiales bacterium]|jgi:beta-galactosidase/beta-glucuronidase|nr:glycoside hydrolase family 2 [Clostridiales bacterium]